MNSITENALKFSQIGIKFAFALYKFNYEIEKKVILNKIWLRKWIILTFKI